MVNDRPTAKRDCWWQISTSAERLDASRFATTLPWRRHEDRDRMSLINLTVQHGQTLEEARRRLERAVHEVSGRFAALVRRGDWGAGRNRVEGEGGGVSGEMWGGAGAGHAAGGL